MAQGIGSNSEYKALLNQMQGVFGQLSSFGGIKGGSYLNTIWSVAGNAEQLATGNESQKASAIQGLINNVLSIVEKLGNQEAANARKEVKRSEEDAKKLAEEQQKALTELNNGLEEIGNDIANQASIVSTANGTIETAQKDLQEKQEQINEIIEKIQEKQKELASTTDPEKQKELLSAIQGLSGQIAGIIAEVETIQINVQAAAEEVEAAVTDIETAKGNAVEVQENGELKITELAQQGAENVAETTQTQVKGVENSVTAKALEAAANASSSNFVTASAAAELSISAADQESAAGIRATGALGNLRNLMQGIGGLSDNINLLATFKNAIGGALETFNGYVGDYNSIIEPVITSIGSFVGEGGIAATTESLNEAIESDMEIIDGRLSGEEPAEESEDSSEEAVVNEDNLSGLSTPNVKLNPFKVA